eukprot:12929740-Ditylum_brightwellii.AAC.1
MARAEQDMEWLRSELEDARRRKGQCPTCGRKCYRRKIFKMEPITDHGRVLNGRCLYCNPLEVANQLPLHALCQEKNVSNDRIKELLLQHPQAIETKDDYQQLPLHVLCANDNITFDMLKAL